MKVSLGFILTILLAILFLSAALIPINWELNVAEKFFSYPTSANWLQKGTQAFMGTMEFSSQKQLLRHLLNEGRKLSLYSALCLFLFSFLTKYYQLSIKDTFHFKSRLLNRIIGVHLLLFCFICGWWFYYINYSFQHYYGKSIEEIRGEKNTPWSSSFYHFVQRCLNEIPEEDNVLLIIDSFSRLNPKYHLYFNYFLYPRKVYIHIEGASNHHKLHDGSWQQKYSNSGISLNNLNSSLLQQKNISWIIRYQEDLIFQKNKCKLIRIEELDNLREE